MGVYAVYLDAVAERRLHAIARETGRKVEDLIASAAEEEALGFFRHRSDDPGRPPARREVA
ncbi:hypothetical protein ACLI1C_16215 [Devosia sp. XGJD_8]|uniref:hypothetical protein n=1 Tax=Devosia sp. XGJD_8 TaxID=3391187 RepID=UPI0039852935